MILTESLNLRNFWATEAALLAVMLAYNLMSLFRQAILRSDAVSDKADVQYTLKTLLYELFAKAGYIARVGRKKIINLAVAMQQREWIDGLWNKSKTFNLPAKLTSIHTHFLILKFLMENLGSTQLVYLHCEFDDISALFSKYGRSFSIPRIPAVTFLTHTPPDAMLFPPQVVILLSEPMPTLPAANSSDRTTVASAITRGNATIYECYGFL